MKTEPDGVEESSLKARTCARCEKANPATAALCNRCGLPMDVGAAMNAQDERKEWDDRLTTLMRDPETVRFLVAKAKQMRLSL